MAPRQRSNASPAGRGAAAVALLTLCACGGGQEDPTSDPLRADPRIQELLEPCARSGYYDRAVDDLTPILIEKLQTSGGDPLRRAKEELGEMGERAASDIRRLVDASFTNQLLGPHLENAIDAASLNPTREAHDVLLRALDHPMETVRHRAMLGMVSRHALPEDFDTFLFRIDGPEAIDVRRLYLSGMFVADAERAEATCLDWIEEGSHREFWMDAAQRIGKSRSAATGRRAAGLYADLPSLQAHWIAAPAVRAGDAGALAYLQSELAHEEPNRRLGAVRALAAAGRTEELVQTLQADPDDTVRLFALQGIADSEAPAASRAEWMSGALGDGAPTVRGQALKELCALHDPAALDLAVAHLGEDAGLLSSALQALREPLLADPELARRAYERLLERHRLEELRPVQERSATYKAMGLVPLAEAAAFLRRIALESEGEVIESLRAHDWLMIQASNTGSAGRAFLREELERETDGVRRLDLIGAIASTRAEGDRDWARDELLDLVERDGVDGYELLFAAGNAAKLGPSVVVAPRLRQVCIAIEDPEIQVALQCLLWTWY
jgi:hypothetical protein